MQTMTTTRLGRTGLKVSRICLGCMSYGGPDRGNQPWALDEEASRPFIKQALEVGINFFDTANVYSDGTSEEILGRALRTSRARDEVVIATKVTADARRGRTARPVAQGDPRRDRRQPAPARHRLHGPLPDPPLGLRTPIEETLEALNDVVSAGKARYIGASSMYAWQFCKALHIAERHGWTRFVACRTTTTCSTVRRSARCCRCAPPKASASSRGARWRAAGWPAPGTPTHATDPRPTSSARRCTADRGAIADGRARRRRWPRARRVARAGRAGLAVAQAGRHRADRRRHQAASPRRCRRRAVARRSRAEEIAALEAPYAPHGVLGHA